MLTGWNMDVVKVGRLPAGRQAQHPQGMAEQEDRKNLDPWWHSKDKLSCPTLWSLYLLNTFNKKEINLYFT